MFRILIAITVLFLPLLVQGDYLDGGQGYQNANGYKFSGDFPYDKRKISQPKEVQKARFELNIEQKKANKIRQKIVKTKEILDGLAGVNLLQNPIFKPLKTVSTIYLHPNFITTIIFPKKFHIANKPKISFPYKTFEYDNNTIRIRPTTDTSMGNIVLSLSDGKKNYSLNIFYKRYLPDLKCEKTQGKNCKNNYLATVIKYVVNKNFSPFEIIEEYEKLHNVSKIDIKNNLDYLIYSKKGQTYYIIRDDEFGTIYKDGLSLKVKTTL